MLMADRRTIRNHRRRRFCRPLQPLSPAAVAGSSSSSPSTPSPAQPCPLALSRPTPRSCRRCGTPPTSSLPFSTFPGPRGTQYKAPTLHTLMSHTARTRPASSTSTTLRLLRLRTMCTLWRHPCSGLERCFGMSSPSCRPNGPRLPLPAGYHIRPESYQCLRRRRRCTKCG